jgi:tetratricopeptide (TPR) repeat protein
MGVINDSIEPSMMIKRGLLLNTVLLLIAAISFSLLSSCSSTQKNKDEVGFVGRKFHDLTARYNGYFNANELYKESKLQLEDGYQDNYNNILNIYPYESVENPESVTASMDEAIKKVIKVSTLHEVSKWVDDCYVLLGKAQYLKGDYESAQETFAYFVDDFNPKDPDSRVYISADRDEDAKARKKEKERERKVQQKERDQARKEAEKAREEEKKARKKAKKDREKNGSRKRKAREVIEDAKEKATGITDKIEGIASNDVSLEAAPTELDEDEAYLKSIEEEKKNKKKLTENPFDAGFLKHGPAYYEGMMWLSKSYIKRDKWLDAKYYLDKIVEDGFATKEILAESHIVRADMHIKMKDYNEALKSLDVAIEANKNKELRARLTFIKGQIHQIKGNAAQASEAFSAVDDYKPSFEMELHAEMNQLRNGWAAGTTTSDAAIKKLKRLSNESKNEPYLGSIYFTQAEILLADGRTSEAFEKFNEALANSSGTNKTEIYNRLATLYLSREEYVNAKNYFDSTLTIMPKADERYPTVERYATNLKSIASNIRIIEFKDSLLRLGNLSPRQLEAYALEEAKKLKEQQEKQAEEGNQISITTSVSSGNSRFFAYNPSTVLKGRQDFNKRWGSRPLEDNWRRSNKSSSEIDEELDVVVVEEEVDYTEEINKIIRDIPTDEASQAKANAQIEQALFELGTGFRTYIENYSKSNETLTELLERYPDTEHRVEAYYYLHLNHVDLNDQNKADIYKRKLIGEFPNSPFAIFLTDPSNEKALLTDEKKIELYYENTYEEFEAGNFQLVFDRLEQGRKDFGQEHKLAAKFDLLRAMAIGNIDGQNEYINALRGVILKHNNTDEQTYAREMMRFLRGDQEAFGEQSADQDVSKYKVEKDKLHYVIFLLYGGDGNLVNDFKTELNKYNAETFAQLRIRSTSLFLNQENKTHLVLLRRFSNAEQAMEYYHQFNADSETIFDGSEYSYDLYAVNQLNYREIITSKSANAYRVFFEANYLNDSAEDK